MITNSNNPTVHSSGAYIHSRQITLAFIRIDLGIGQVLVPDQFCSLCWYIVFIETRHVLHEFGISHDSFGRAPVVIDHFVASSGCILDTLRFDIFQNTNDFHVEFHTD